jgi:integrase
MMAITKSSIERMKPPKSGHRIEFDSEIKGFGVRMTHNGVISYILNYRVNGRQRRYTIARYPDWSLERARKEAARLRAEIRPEQGKAPIDPLEEKRREREAPTVQRLRDDYLERWAIPRKRAKSIRDDKAMLETIIVPRFGNLAVEAVTRRDVEGLHNDLVGTPFRANRVLSLLSKMFSLAVEWGWRPDNPAAGIQKHHEDRRERYLTHEELARLADALDKYPAKRADELDGSAKQKAYARREAKRAVDALRLLMVSGARKSEVLNATWEQFDLERGIWVKPSSATKQRKTERIPLSEQAIELLRSLPKDGPLLFRGRREGQPLSELKGPWADICKMAKLKNCRMHDLRHSFASFLVSSGVSLPTIGALLGHRSPTTTARYAHLLDSPLRTATNLFPKI